ncbi:hypothetical protein [Carnobacterium mobile]|uniref:hypothetical protein n=1 Tax=Carnobacterium mobile TaxID=2750 RepID=UPI00054DECC4|nr:hypothetical protein [Carnobacterium mobile]
MDTCEVFFSNGESLKVNLSQAAFNEIINTEDGMLDSRLVLLENQNGDSIYINPLQITFVTADFKNFKDEVFTLSERVPEEEHESHNLEAIQDLSKDIDNME